MRGHRRGQAWAHWERDPAIGSAGHPASVSTGVWHPQTKSRWWPRCKLTSSRAFRRRLTADQPATRLRGHMEVRALCRRGRTQSLAAFVVVVMGLVAPSAFGQSIGLSPSTPVDLSLSVPSAEVLGEGTLAAAVTAVFSSDPFVVILPSQVSDSVVTRRSELAVGLSYSAWHRLLVAVNLPMVLAQSGE